ncbi:MAG: DUF349 domain-containing protein [Proteobacteria bacterium]|nr:DUF349 domain-containing protein [Pseudomonadota bacterium]
MLAKLLRMNAGFAPSALQSLPQLQTAEQLALLDQYLAYCKAHERSSTDELQVLALLETTAADSAIEGTGLEVAKRAVTIVDDVDALAGLLDHPGIGDFTAKRLSKLLPMDSAHGANQHPSLFPARLESAKSTDIEQLSKLVSNAEQAAWLVVRAPESSRTSLLELPVLQGESGLATLEKISRGRDKGCNRLARGALEKIRDCRRLYTSHLTALDDIAESTLRELKFVPKDLDALIVQRKKLNQLHSRWQQLLTDIDVAETALQAAGEPTTAFVAATNPFDGLDLSVPAAQDNPYPALLDQVAALAELVARAQSISADDAAQHGATMATLDDAWQQADGLFPPSQAQQEQFANANQRIRAGLQSWQRLHAVSWQTLTHPTEQAGQTATPKALADWLRRARHADKTAQWPSHLPPPDLLAKLRQDIAKTAAQEKELAARQQALSAELKTLSATLQALIDNGEFKRALSGLKNCRQLQKLGAVGAEKALNTISAQLGELSDWQQFAASPKRDALVQSVKDLVATPLHPDDQRAALKTLREQWNALGPLPREQRQLQQAFDDLADQAFAVCREHFAQQNLQRRENLKARRALCDQLQQYLDSTDWANADMRAAEHIMRQARVEWRRYHPCDRKALKSVESTFEALQDDLHARVKKTWDTNIAAKQALIDEAQTLVAQEHSEDLAAQAMALQARWREVGATPRSADQKLWKKFRGACDAVFARLQSERNSQRDEQQQRTRALVADIASFDPEALPVTEAENALAELDERASALRLSAEPRSQLRDMKQAIRARRESAKNAAKVEKLAEFRAWDEAVTAAEINGETITSPHSMFHARVAGSPEPTDRLALTMEAEMAADIAGPTAEQSQRMALQIELMNQGRRNLQLLDNQQLLQRWCASGPKNADDEPLRQRFFSALGKRLS